MDGKRKAGPNIQIQIPGGGNTRQVPTIPHSSIHPTNPDGSQNGAYREQMQSPTYQNYLFSESTTPHYRSPVNGGPA